MPTNDGLSGVSNCYVFKSRLQEYAQKKGLSTPAYETIREGPSHEPSFRSTVIVKDIRYESLPGFFNRKAAEQSAAEVALMELSKSDDINDCISQPVHETGLCKNLLQEYAQKMNYAIPLYQCEKIESGGRLTLFKCTIDIGGIQYIGASAKTKKEAEIKAARTALLAIQSSASESSHNGVNNYQLTVIPFRKRAAETAQQEAVTVPKTKKARLKKKPFKKKLSGFKAAQNQSSTSNTNLITNEQSESDQIDASVVQETNHQLVPVIATNNSQDEKSVPKSSDQGTTDVTDALTCHLSSDFGIGPSAAAVINQNNNGTPSQALVESNGQVRKILESSPTQIGTLTVTSDLNFQLDQNNNGTPSQALVESNREVSKISESSPTQIGTSTVLSDLNLQLNQNYNGTSSQALVESNVELSKMSESSPTHIGTSTVMSDLNPMEGSIETGAGQ